MIGKLEKTITMANKKKYPHSHIVLSKKLLILCWMPFIISWCCLMLNWISQSYFPPVCMIEYQTSSLGRIILGNATTSNFWIDVVQNNTSVQFSMIFLQACKFTEYKDAPWLYSCLSRTLWSCKSKNLDIVIPAEKKKIFE